MFIGHYTIAFAAKKVAPKISLGTLFLSSQFIDLLWPLFLLLGLEHVRIDPGNTAFTPLDFYDYPFTHSLAGVLFWSLLLGLLYFVVRRHATGAWVVAACTFSHWVLDAVTHRPDLPLAPGSSVCIGLGLWNSVAGTVVVEFAMFFLGFWLYVTSTTAQSRIGKYALWSLAAFLLVIWVGNIFGPPPPSEAAIAILGNAGWLFVFWAYWIDRHRTPPLNGKT